MKLKRSRTERSDVSKDSPLRFFLYRFLFTLGVSLVLLLLSAAADYLTNDPGGNAPKFALAALYLSALIGGILVSPSNLPFYISGLIPGSVFLLLISAVPLALPECASSYRSFPISLLLHLAVIAAFILGSFLGNVRKNAPKVKRRRRKKHA